jgi:hypothetical protein
LEIAWDVDLNHAIVIIKYVVYDELAFCYFLLDVIFRIVVIVSGHQVPQVDREILGIRIQALEKLEHNSLLFFTE